MEHIGEAAKAVVIDTARKYVKRPDVSVTEQRKALAVIAYREIHETQMRLEKIMRKERERSASEKTLQLAYDFIRAVEAFMEEAPVSLPMFPCADVAGRFVQDRATDLALIAHAKLGNLRWNTKKICNLLVINDDNARHIHKILDDLRDLNTPTIMWLRHMGVE